MEYQVLARKWRPMSFSDMIGQEHITRTLQNALLNEKAAHAYLFVGPRGIGKTTIARIFAKTLNCKEAPIANPCCKCDSCISIAKGNNIDIIEIDGASNNSVNDIRNLREEVLYTPVNSRYKVYIIDEVHMLSSSAWNALLKTLEEPPSHVKFLFATTEVHKIIPTVLSRCQRFDLRRIPENLIVDRLKQILVDEGVKVSDNAVAAVARAADGGMRDALSLLDQLIAFHLSEGEHEISEQQVLSTFGLTSPEEIYNLVRGIITDDKPSVINAIHEQAVNGKNLEKLFEDILVYLRGVEICQIVDKPEEILEDSSEVINRYKSLSGLAKVDVTQRLLEILSSSGRILHDAINKQVYIETIILKAINQSHAVSINDLIAKINQLAQLSPSGMNDGVSDRITQPTIEKKNEYHPVKKRKNILDDESIPAKQIDLNEVIARADISGEVNKKISAIKNTHKQTSQEQLPEKPHIPAMKSSDERPELEIVKEVEAPAVTVDEKKFSPLSLWHQLIEEMDKIGKPNLKFYLQEAIPRSIADNMISVCFDEEFGELHVEMISDELDVLNKCLQRLTSNREFRIKIVKEKGIAKPNAENIAKRDLESVKKSIEKNSYIQDAIKAFQGRIVDFRG